MAFDATLPVRSKKRHTSSLTERLQQIQPGAATDSTDDSGAKARCDFKIIDDDQDMPTENHMYVLQTLTSPELTRVVTGTTSSEAVVDLLVEESRIRNDIYHADGFQMRCVAVWLHAARMKPLVMRELGPPVVAATTHFTGRTSDGGAAGE